MRMQPEDWLSPMVQGSLVPWMRKYVSWSPCQRYMARAPSGLAGPPWIPNPALQFNHRFHEVRPVVEHFLGRIPVRPFLLALDSCLPRPDESFASDSDAIAGCPAAVLDTVEIVIGGIDNDRPRGFVGRIADIL